MARFLKIAVLTAFLSLLVQAPAWSQKDAAAIAPASPSEIFRDDGARLGDPIEAPSEQSLIPADLSSLKVTFEELLIGGAAIATTFGAAVGSVLIFVPPEAQVAAFAAILAIAVTPIDGLIIGGGAIAGYRYLTGEDLKNDTEDALPGWYDRWSYKVN